MMTVIDTAAEPTDPPNATMAFSMAGVQPGEGRVPAWNERQKLEPVPFGLLVDAVSQNIIGGWYFFDIMLSN